MKTWKIGLYFVCIIFGLIWLARYSGLTEGFDITTFNVSYPTKELFLVAPNINVLSSYVEMYRDSYDTGNNLVNSQYNSAYSFEDAKAMCTSFGATLATPAQISIGTSLGAKWCVAGWASDGSMYAPIQRTCPNTRRNTTGYSASGSSGGSANTSALVKFTGANAPTKAYPLCWGLKPSEPTVNVREFNLTDYSMFGATLLNEVMNGDPTDLFPVEFSSDQATYALEQTNYNIGAAKDTNPARDYLVARIGSVNDQIYQTDLRYSEDGSNRGIAPCTILANTRAKFKGQFEQLRQVFRDVSGAVIAMLGAKNESSFFTAKLQGICAQESRATSPACVKLATLDFDLLYSTQGSDGDPSTSRLAALEALNYFKFARERELCIDYNNIAAVESYLGCTNEQGSIPECVYSGLGSGSGSASASASGPPLTLNNFDVNSEEFLKQRLKEIAPYFSSSDYYKLLEGIIAQLSITLRLPSLNDFNDSTQNLKLVQNRIDAIRSYMKYSV
jgi:hypothetical protein